MAEHSLDLVGDICPIPLLKTEREMKKIRVGDVLLIETEHGRVVRNICDWAHKHGHRIEMMAVSDGIWRLKLIKIK